MDKLREFYKGKKVLLTGHTGFKGAWLAIWLRELGAEVIGYSLDPDYEDSVFELTKLKEKITDIRADVRNLEKLKETFRKHSPDIVFHLAAQPLVRRSYDEPHYTFETNLMGTVNILECIKEFSTKAAVIITTDKTYRNKETEHGYKEEDELGGHDPYSSSKAASEMAIEAYRASFSLNVASARAGNVIGGGDWAKDRIVADCFRALKDNKPIEVRNPESRRPWQHVLEPSYGYLLLGMKLYSNKELAGPFNFGPKKENAVTVKKLVELIIKHYGKGEWMHKKLEDNKKETKLLILNPSKAEKLLNWKPKLTIDQAVKLTVEGYKNLDYDLCRKQIEGFM